MVVLLSYFVVEYDGLAPTGLDNTTINILLTKGDGDLDGSIIFFDNVVVIGERKCLDNNDNAGLGRCTSCNRHPYNIGSSPHIAR